MTCIVGLVHEGRVYIGGDSASSNGHVMIASAVSKIWSKDGWAFGCTTSWRMNQLLRYALVMPRVRVGQDLMEYMCTDFIDAVRNAFRTGGFLTKEKESEMGGTFLVGHVGRLFRVDSDYQVGEAILPYEACGSGEDVARGSLWTTARYLTFNPDPYNSFAGHLLDEEVATGERRTLVQFNPEARCRMALEAAAEHVASVRGPHTVVFAG